MKGKKPFDILFVQLMILSAVVSDGMYYLSVLFRYYVIHG